MIERTIGFRASDGTVHDTLEGAQKAEIELLLKEDNFGDASGHPAAVITAAGTIIKHKVRILDILTTGPKSRPKARSVNGAKRTRKPKVIPALAEALEQTKTA